MKEGWEERPLGELCELYQPKTITTKQMMPDGEYPVFGANGLIGRYSRFNHEQPQLLVTCRGATCGTINVSEPKSWITGNSMVVKPSVMDLELSYLRHFLSQEDVLANCITGSAQPQITRKSLSPVRVSYPPLPEQRRIVAILDEAFEGIAAAKANAERNLKNAREVFEAVLDNSLDAALGEGKKSRLGDLVTRLTNGYVGPTRSIYTDSGVPYLLARHVRDNVLRFDGKTYVSDLFNNRNKKSILKEGDVLLVQSGHIGHSAVVPQEHEGHNCHAMIVISTKPDAITGEFLSLVFNSSRMRQAFWAIRSGSTVPHLTCKAVKELPIPTPSIDLQKELVSRSQRLSSQAESLVDMIGSKAAALDELKASLLHQAFTGNL